jgi:hypothetical protein
MNFAYTRCFLWRSFRISGLRGAIRRIIWVDEMSVLVRDPILGTINSKAYTFTNISTVLLAREHQLSSFSVGQYAIQVHRRLPSGGSGTVFPKW